MAARAPFSISAILAPASGMPRLPRTLKGRTATRGLAGGMDVPGAVAWADPVVWADSLVRADSLALAGGLAASVAKASSPERSLSGPSAMDPGSNSWISPKAGRDSRPDDAGSSWPQVARSGRVDWAMTGRANPKIMIPAMTNRSITSHRMVLRWRPASLKGMALT